MRPGETQVMSEHKTHKGGITIRRKIELSPEQKERADRFYGPNLGYLYEVDFHDHPVFRGMEAMGGRTSLVVKDDGVNVETLNSKYTVKKFR